MSAVRAKSFVKTRACPASDDISSRRGRIADSEFCATEQSRLPASGQTKECEAAEMSAHLPLLAEELLRGNLKDVLFRIETRKLSSRCEPGFRV